MDFKDKIVLITGASRGIGESTAVEFAKRNATVIIGYHNNKEKANKVLKALNGTNHSVCSADISSKTESKKLIDFVIYKYGRIDILVNNAGILIPHEPTSVNYDTWIDAWTKTINTNLMAPAYLCYLAANAMIKQGRGGRIVNVTSRGAFRGEPTQTAYGASKAALNSLTQSLAKALGKHNIIVNAVAPGFVETEMAKVDLSGPNAHLITGESPLNRVAKPEEVAYTIVFLASKGAEFTTGAIVDVNGASYLRT